MFMWDDDVVSEGSRGYASVGRVSEWFIGSLLLMGHQRWQLRDFEAFLRPFSVLR